VDKGITKEEIIARILCPDEMAAFDRAQSLMVEEIRLVLCKVWGENSNGDLCDNLYDKDLTPEDALIEIGNIVGYW